MGRKTLALILLITAFSCTKENFTINGKLYFKSIDFVNLSRASNEEKLKFKDYFSGLNTSATLSADEKKLVSYFRTLEKLKLVDAPYIKILDDKGKVFTVFTTDSDYLKFANFKVDKLIADKKAVNLKVAIKQLDTDIYFLEEIVNLELVNGETPWNK